MSLGRAERALLAVAGVMVGAVGIAIVRAPRRTHREPQPQVAAAPSDSVATPSAPVVGQQVAATRPEVALLVQRSSMPEPVRDTADIRSRVAGDAGRTYLLSMLDEDDWRLVRWPDRRMEALRVWVRPSSAVADWTPEYAQLARRTFEEWGSSGSPLHFVFTIDSAGSDVWVTWIDRFPPDAGQRIGSTTRETDQHGWIASAAVTVAVHDSAGNAFSPSALIGIVRHEVGHALGLGHSPDRTSMMYFEETVNDIAPVDRETLRLLYTLPPGSMKGILDGR